MSKIKIHAGDYKGSGSFTFSVLVMPWQPGDGFSAGKTYHLTDIESIEAASEEAVKRIGGTVGWGVAGGLIFGPVGLLAGLIFGGKSKDVTFVAKFKDGKKILATTDNGAYTKLLAATF